MKRGRRSGIIFLLGAGASRDAGLPATAGFFDCLRESFARARESEDLKLVEDEERLFEFVRNGLLAAALSSPFVDPGNFEHVISAVDDLRYRFRTRLFPFVKNWAPGLEEFSGHGGQPGGLGQIPAEWPRPWDEVTLATAGDWFFPASEGLVYDRLYNRVHLALRDWLRVSEVHDVSYLARLADFGEDVHVFTLNYDLALETACLHHQVPWTTGFSEAGDWTPELFEESKFRLKLFKLHGSVNWYRRKIQGAQSTIFEIAQHPVQESKSIYDDEAAALEKYITWMGYPPPPMIFAHGNKLPGYDPYIFLFSRFLQALRCAQCLVIIGCRWRAEPTVRALISREVVSAPPRLRMIEVTKSRESPSLENLTCGTKEALETTALNEAWARVASQRENHCDRIAQIKKILGKEQ